MAIEGIILDVDGTLVLSNDTHAQAWIEAFAAYEYEIPFEQVRPLIGMGGDQVIPRLVAELNSEQGVGKQIADRRKELVVNKFGAEVAPTSGARELVQKMQDDGLHLIVATSATEQEMELLLKVAQVDDLISEFTTSSEAEASKPEPDLVEAALSKANLQADRTVMLGDTPYDIESAGKAGVSVIAFRSGGFSDQQLQGAIAIYDDPADLLRHYETSPLAASVPLDITASSESMMPDTSTTESAAEAWRSIQAKTTTFLEKARSYTPAFFKNNRQLLTTLGWILLAFLGTKVLFAGLDAIDDIPLVTPILKLIGLVYVLRFVWRYLIREQNRQELMQALNRAKTELLGN